MRNLGNNTSATIRTEAGKQVILKIGPASVVIGYLTIADRQKMNLLCRKAYAVILPGISDISNIKP